MVVLSFYGRFVVVLHCSVISFVVVLLPLQQEIQNVTSYISPLSILSMLQIRQHLPPSDSDSGKTRGGRSDSAPALVMLTALYTWVINSYDLQQSSRDDSYYLLIYKAPDAALKASLMSQPLFSPTEGINPLVLKSLNWRISVWVQPNVQSHSYSLTAEYHLLQPFKTVATLKHPGLSEASSGSGFTNRNQSL